MRCRGSGVVRSVRSIGSTERITGSPALLGKNPVAKASGVVGPGGVLRVVGDA